MTDLLLVGLCLLPLAGTPPNQLERARLVRNLDEASARKPLETLGHVSGDPATFVSLAEDRRINDQRLENLSKLRHVEELRIFHAPVTNQGLRHIAGLKKLRHLDLGYTKISDEG